MNQHAAGQYYIGGIIINKDTNEPVPFANIAIKDAYKGTASNALGEFAFKTDSLPIALVVTHVSFETKLIEVKTEYNRLVVELTPGKLLMDELVVKAKGNDQYAYDLVKRAYYKVLGKGSALRYGKAFYRQISKNGDMYSELYEVFYDTKYSNNGVEDWAIQEGRYALKLSTIDSFIYNKNFTMLVRLLTVIQPKTDDLVMPVSELVDEQYFLKTEDVTSVNNRRLARISFEKMETVETPALEGELLIDTESFDILKITGTVADDDLKFITLKGERGSWKNYVVNCEIAFKPVDDHLALDYMTLGQNFEYYQDNVFMNHVETRAFFTYYEYYEPPKKKRLGGRLMRFGQRDSDILDAIGYNQLFWDENIIVKRTPIESEVIASFEKERAFGSIYLNNKNQVELEDYVIDNDPFIVTARQALKRYQLPAEGEKVFIHHDKPSYISGQSIWWKGYIVNMATNARVPGPGLLQITLSDPSGKSIVKKSFKIHDGIAEGVLDLPPDLKSGVYNLNANTGYMTDINDQFAFEEKLTIIHPTEDTGKFAVAKTDSLKTLVIQPEGGKMVTDIPAQVAFVALDEFGQPIEFKGRLSDEEGKLISQLKSDFNGFGSTFLLPNKDLKYRLDIPPDYKRVGLPEISATGYSVMINNMKPNALDVMVRGTMKFEGRKLYLLFITNGSLFDRRIGVLLKGVYRTEIPKSNFPNGITQVLLVDDVGMIHIRRMVYMEQPHEANVNFYLAKKEFSPREKIDMVLEVNDENGKPIGDADLSISVLNKDKANASNSAQNIRSFFDYGFLFDYEIPVAAELMSADDREGLRNFEFLMLSQQTALPDIRSFSSPDSTISMVKTEKVSMQLTGTALNTATNAPLEHGFLNLVTYPDASLGSWFVRTDDHGKFSLQHIDFSDSLAVFVNALNAEGKAVKVQLDFAGNSGKHVVEIVDKPISDEIRKNLDSYHAALQQGSDESAKAKTVTQAQITKQAVFGKIDQRITISNRASQTGNLLEFFQTREPGTEVTSAGRVMLKGDAVEPLLLVDGFLVNPEALNVGRNESNVLKVPESHNKDILDTAPLQQFDRVEIVRKAPGISFYDVKWDHGVIAVYSKAGNANIAINESEGPALVWLQGYTQPTTIKLPDYSRTTSTAPDLRTTVYWNPDVKVNKKGRVKISFYNSDDAKTLQVCVQGITSTGIPVYEIFDIGKTTGRVR
ncbi:MAG: carboxypeptidase-like regulatory domain-containing protein [Cyclobacteriaceae bacterium]|nr:carboxypeptidase-like regulatory domain-containing protein [Cyclobacteriaceae bacterium]